MNQFPLTREEWYKSRDDRTNRVVEAHLENFKIGIKISTDVKQSYAVQVMALTLSNNLSRWCRSIFIEPINATSILPNSTDEDFAEQLTVLMRNNDPFGDFRLADFKESDVDVSLCVGSLQPPPGNAICINGNGWCAGIGDRQLDDPIPANDFNPVGPAFAACLGSSAAFQFAVSHTPLKLTRWYSLYDLTSGSVRPARNPATPSGSFGKLLQVGCGAVGSSFNFLLSLTKLKGEVHLNEFDVVEPPNCSSSLTFNAWDSVANPPRKKIDACFDVLKSAGLIATKHPGALTADVLDGVKPDIILCFANERGVWPTLQFNYPPLVLHATTTPNWGLNFGRHIPVKDWCIVCRFGITEHKFIPRCAEGEIVLDEKPLLGVLPFLSPAAAVLTLAELLLVSGDQEPRSVNFNQFSFKNLSSSDFIAQNVEKRSDCPVCSRQDPTLHLKVIRSSKYSNLSI